MAAVQFSLPLPVLPQDWVGEKDFKAIGQLSSATQRNIEPVGPHFLAHARRVSKLPLINRNIFAATNSDLQQKRHQRTFSEDDRIQAQENVKKVEDDDVGEISEPEDPLMLQRDAKDWKVVSPFTSLPSVLLLIISAVGTRSLRCPRPHQAPLQSYGNPDQTCPPQKGSSASP